ncbi:MAG: hypothetical protein ACI8Q1_001869, partial [Parvicella sp.]
MRIFLPISILFINLIGFSQTEITWDDLKFDSSSLVWSDKKEAIYLEPYFKNKIEILEDSTIEITGFVSSFDYNRKALILTSALNKSLSNCFSGNEQDEFVEIQLSSKNRTKINDKITVSGSLTLNKDDNSHLKYILEDAKIVVQEPIKITWEELKFDSISEIWNDEVQSKTPICHINNETKKLNGKKVQISGHFVPIDIEAQYFALTFEEVNSHSFFHGNIYPSHIIDLIISPQIIPNMNEKVTIIGTLVLNEDDFLKLNFILENA